LTLASGSFRFFDHTGTGFPPGPNLIKAIAHHRTTVRN
jgi:hypothetical protein